MNILYEPPQTKIEAVDSDFGKIAKPFTSLRPKWKTEPPLKQVSYRYRINNGDWSAWVKEDTEIELPGFAKPGKYEMHVQIASRPRPLRHHLLKYRFEIQYNLETYVVPLVEQLQSDDYETRRDATEKILMLGEAAIPHLEPLMKRTKSAEVRMTSEMIIKLLRSLNQPNEDDQ